MSRAIVYTRRADAGVSICSPTGWAFSLMMNGGGLWADQPRGFLDELVRRKTCPKLQNGSPASEAAAWRMVKALRWGGLSTAEAWDVTRAHDCERHGFGESLVDVADLPDRWFRDAWTLKGSNSGLPYVDLEKARPIQWARIVSAVNRENKRRSLDLFGARPIRMQRMQIERAIRNARDAEELRRIWPQSLLAPQ